MADRHVRRSGDDYASALAALLPTGLAWPRDPFSVLMRTVRGLAQIFGFVDSRSADLLERETDPRLAVEMFTDWERNWGLPDPCFFSDGGGLEGRRKNLMRKMTIQGMQSRAFFSIVASDLGFEAIINEFAPFMTGVSRTGRVLDDTEQPRWVLGPAENRFYWTVRVGDIGLEWWRVSTSQCGIDPHLRIAFPTDLECLLNRWKPAHTRIVFDFSGTQATSNPLAGTP